MQSLLVVINALPFILQGCVVTVAAVGLALSMGLCFGLPFAIIQVYGHPFFRRLLPVYVWFFRGVPILVLLSLFFVLISCIAMGCTSTAYQSQIFRGALESIPSGQLKAARALGMGDLQAIRSIILPQAMRIAIPGWANEFSILLKDSAVCYVLGTQDIMARTAAVAARTHEALALYAAAGVIYFVLTIIVLKLLHRLEVKVQIPGYSGDNNFSGNGAAA